MDEDKWNKAIEVLAWIAVWAIIVFVCRFNSKLY